MPVEDGQELQRGTTVQKRSWRRRALWGLLLFSLFLNVCLYGLWQQYLAPPNRPQEKFHSGAVLSENKIAIVSVTGTIMPPFTDRVLKAIRRAGEDDSVRGVVLSVDSPGGLVADSHQIYHELQKLKDKKPVYVAMKRMAASGGVYVAMGAGPSAPIYVEPTTWTGSIGVIIPRYNLSGVTEKLGVAVEPLKTGPFKDSLSPFRDMSEEDRELWTVIMNDAFERFIKVIDENREGLDAKGVRELATGQIFTAEQALSNGLVDRMGYMEDAIDDLKEQLGLDEARVVKYESPASLFELLMGAAARSQHSEQAAWNSILEATVPRAMYYTAGAIPPMVPFRE